MQRLLLLSLFMLSLSFSSEFRGHGLDSKVEYFRSPRRQHSIIISESGYLPKNISIFEGESIDFFITSIDSESACMVINEVNMFVSSRKGQVVNYRADFESAGKYKFYCPATKHHGHVTVLPKVKKQPKRSIASIKEKQEWIPKDY